MEGATPAASASDLFSTPSPAAAVIVDASTTSALSMSTSTFNLLMPSSLETVSLPKSKYVAISGFVASAAGGGDDASDADVSFGSFDDVSIMMMGGYGAMAMAWLDFMSTAMALERSYHIVHSSGWSVMDHGGGSEWKWKVEVRGGTSRHFRQLTSHSRQIFFP